MSRPAPRPPRRGFLRQRDTWLHWRKNLSILPHLTAAALLAGIIKVVLIVVAVAAGVLVAHRVEQEFTPHGGIVPITTPPGPPPIAIGGATPPREVWQGKYTIRNHNQCSSNSCVNQSEATMQEMMNAARGIRIPVSGGYVWNRCNGGYDAPIQIDCALAVWQNNGIPWLGDYGNDGCYVGYANPYLQASPGNHLRGRYYWIYPWDSDSIKRAMAAGAVIAVLGGWGSSLVNANGYFGAGPITYVTTDTYYWHMTVADGYSSVGLRLKNSYAWGDYRQEKIITWPALASWHDNAGRIPYVLAVVPEVPLLPIPHKPRIVIKKVFPATVWNAPIKRYNAKHRKHQRKLIPYKDRKGHLRRISASWWYGKHTKLGGIVQDGRWHQRDRKHGVTVGYMTYKLEHGKATLWPYHVKWHVKFHPFAHWKARHK